MTMWDGLCWMAFFSIFFLFFFFGWVGREERGGDMCTIVLLYIVCLFYET